MEEQANIKDNEKIDPIILVNLDYLKQLDNPQEVFTKESWNIMIKNINNRFEANKDFEDIKSKQLSELAPHFGILWRQKSDVKLEDFFIEKQLGLDELFVENIVNIKNQNKTNTWRAKGITILMANLFSISNEELKDIAKSLYTPSRKEALESQCDYNAIKVATFKELNTAKNNINNDNYEDIMKNLIKTVGKSLIINGNFYNIAVEKYIKIFYYRFFLLKGYENIHLELGIHQGTINNVLNKFHQEFLKAFDEDNFKLLCRKYENAYEKAFAELDDSDLDKRNKRLKIFKRFQHYFITDNLADYID